MKRESGGGGGVDWGGTRLLLVGVVVFDPLTVLDFLFTEDEKQR